MYEMMRAYTHSQWKINLTNCSAFNYIHKQTFGTFKLHDMISKHWFHLNDFKSTLVIKLDPGQLYIKLLIQKETATKAAAAAAAINDEVFI